MQDYKKSVQEQLGKQNSNGLLNNFGLNANQHELLRHNIHDKEPFKKTPKINNKKAIDFLKTLKKSEGVLYQNKIVDQNITQIGDHKKKQCWYLEKYKPSLMLGKIVRKECSRRSNFDGKFLSIMTNVLNEYADTMFKFTEEMTEILLENIFGPNTDLRNNILDVNKLLKYLRKSVDLHKSHTHVITLKSRHCLTLSMPGCYCKSGYVESSGQCVKPSDCVADNYTKYLKRIVIV